MKIRKGLLRFVSPELSIESRLNIARRRVEELEALEPSDLITVLIVLSHDKDEAISAEAKKSISELSVDFIQRALKKKLDPLILRSLYTYYREDYAIGAAVASNPGADEPLLYAIAHSAPRDVISVFGENREALLTCPALLEGLKKNPEASRELIERVEGFLKDLPREVEPGGPQPHHEEEPLPDEGFMEEDYEGDRLNVYKLVSRLTAGEKIKLALTGQKAVRELLVKDKNKIVSMSVLKNPRITDQEIIRIASSKTSSDDLLREVAGRREWIKSYAVKMAIVLNPKTPLNYSLKFLDFLYDRDLKKIANSKNVPGVLANAARQKLTRKGRG
ncbi:MAG: hypothetical protein ACE5EB_04930 [Thermodesulfobacteriota bacterium]